MIVTVTLRYQVRADSPVAQKDALVALRESYRFYQGRTEHISGAGFLVTCLSPVAVINEELIAPYMG